MELFISAVTLLYLRRGCSSFKQFCLPSLWMGDNCKTFSVSRIIHFNAIFRFNGAGSFELRPDGNLQPALSPLLHCIVKGKAPVLSLQIYNHMHDQFLIESERRKITLMFWNRLDIFPSGYRIPSFPGI